MFSKFIVYGLLVLSIPSLVFASYFPASVRTAQLGPVGLNPTSINVPESGFETTYFTLSASTVGGGPGYALSFVKWGSTGGQYRVPNGKTLYCPQWNYNTSAVTNQFTFGYDTASFSNVTDMTTLTAPVFYGGTTTSNAGFTSGNPNSINTDAKTNVWASSSLPLSFPQNMYPFVAVMINAQNYYFNMLCKETTP